MDRPDCIVHIGHTKTGSTSIQECMARHRSALARRGVAYPRTPGSSNHVLIPVSVADPARRFGGVHPAFWGGEPPDAVIERFRTAFPAEMAALPAETRLVVLSSEQAVHMLPDVASMTRLREALAPHFSRVRIVVYLRRQDQHYASAYSQLLRDGHLLAPGLPEPGTQWDGVYDYAGLLRRWAEAFGTENVLPQRFPGASEGGDVVDHFLRLCDAPGVVPPDDPGRQANASITTVGQALMVAAGPAFERLPERRSDLSDPVWRHFVALAGELLPGKGWTPGGEEARRFMARFEEGNEWVRATWFPDEPRLFDDGYPDRPSGTFPEGNAIAPHAMTMLVQLARRHLNERVARLHESARLELRTGNPTAALAHLERAVALDEESGPIRLLLATALHRLDRIEPARHHLAVARERLGADHAGVRRVTRLLDQGSA